MSFSTKAVLFAEDSAFVNFLRSFLFKHGFRETEITRDASEIQRLLDAQVWPIIFVDHSEGYSDALAIFEGLYRQRGFELLTYVFVSTPEKTQFEKFYKTLGARGVIHKPLQPLQAEKVMKEIIPPAGDKATLLALEASKLLTQESYDKALMLLAKLITVPKFARSAMFAVIRCEIATGQYARAEERLLKFIQTNPHDLRAKAEYCEIFRKRSQYSEALKYFRQIHDVHPQMTLKVWEQVLLHLELDEIEEATAILLELEKSPTYRDMAVEALARVMLFMGLNEHVEAFLKPFPPIYKRYNLFVENLANETQAT